MASPHIQHIWLRRLTSATQRRHGLPLRPDVLAMSPPLILTSRVVRTV